MTFLRKYYSQLLFAIIGIIAGFFISRLPIKFEDKISWIALLNFFLTIALAVYLEFIVRPSFSNNRNEKDILIEMISDLENDLKELHQCYSDCRQEQPLSQKNKNDLLKHLRKISNGIDLLKQTDSYCTITTKTEMSDKVFREYLNYKKALTGYSFDDPNFFYDRLYWGRHHKSYKDLMQALVHSMIDVNKL